MRAGAYLRKSGLRKRHYLATLTIIYLVTFIFILAARGDDLVNDRLVEAIIEVESGGRADAVSSCGAVGLAQITPICLKEVNEAYKTNILLSDLFDPVVNIYVAKLYLRLLQTRYDCNTIEEILSAYHIGPFALAKINYKWKKSKDATRYVKKVLKIYHSQ